MSTIVSALSSGKARHKSKYRSCPPSRESTGNILNSPTERFAKANGRKNSLQNKYSRKHTIKQIKLTNGPKKIIRKFCLNVLKCLLLSLIEISNNDNFILSGNPEYLIITKRCPASCMIIADKHSKKSVNASSIMHIDARQSKRYDTAKVVFPTLNFISG